jgi:hypothetical protein
MSGGNRGIVPGKFVVGKQVACHVTRFHIAKNTSGGWRYSSLSNQGTSAGQASQVVFFNSGILLHGFFPLGGQLDSMSSRNELTCLAGEYLVCSRLAGQGWLPLLPPARHRDWDVLAERDGKTRLLQVKTCRRGSRWILTRKHETVIPGLIFAFVSMKDQQVCLVPSEDVARYVRTTHQEFLARGGGDSAIQNFRAKDEWLERWDLLG